MPSSLLKMENSNFAPTSFLRCHSKNNDPCDFQTQLWGCQFSPGFEDAQGKMQELLATCGGYSACVIDAHSEQVVLKFVDDIKSECFYTLSWSLFEQGDLLLAVAGKKGTIHTFCLATKSLYHSFSVSGDRRSPGVFTLLFDEQQPNLLYAGATDGRVYVWNIQPPSLGDSESPSLLRIIATGQKTVVRTLTYMGDGCVAASADDKLFCFSVKCKNLVAEVLGPIEVIFDGCPDLTGYIDSIISVDGHLAVKRSDSELIELYDLSPLRTLSFLTQSVTVKCTKTFQFTKSVQEELFMGGTKGKGTMFGCGDDDGLVWLYNSRSVATAQNIPPARKLAYPDVEDPHAFSIGAYEKCINRVCFSEDENVMACVTANNIVCIWRKVCANGEQIMKE